MKRLIGLLLVLLVCAGLPAAAETSVGSQRMAVVNGEVYCITGKSERGQTTIHRMTKNGPEAVYRCPGQAWYLFEMNDRLLLVTEEETFLESLLSVKETLGTMVYRLVDPATGEAEILDELTQWGIYCRDDALVRRGAETVGEKLTIWEERLEDGVWARTWEWTMDAERTVSAPLDSILEEYVLLESVSSGYRLKDVLLYSRETQRVYELRGLPPGVPMTLQDGVLYSLHRDGLYASGLETGQRRQLLPLPEGNRIDFAMDGAYIALLEYGRVQVYDRQTLACLHVVQLLGNAYDWVLQDGMLYLYDPYAFMAVIDLASGECWTGRF